MRKELVWVAIIGISVGLIVAFGVWRVNATLKPKKVLPGSTPQPQTTTSTFQIVLDKPENDDVISQNTTTVSGITKPLSWMTISGEQDDYIIQSDDQGTFSQDVNLISGVNQIKITAFDQTGNQSIGKVLVVYSSAFQTTSNASPTPDQNATSDSAIRQNVAAKVAAILNKPKAYIGTVTDITDSTIQIKTTDSQIKQISTASNSIVVIDTTPTVKTVKLTDMGIGDFIVAMGYVNSNSVLLAQRVLITDPITEPKIDSTYGKVTDTSKKILTVSALVDSKNNNLTPDTKTDIESYSNGKLTKVKQTSINKNDMVIYITDNSGDSPVIRSVFVIQKAQN